MELQEISISIDKDGKVRVEVHGVKGTSCLDITAALEAALGGQIERVMTPEANDSPQIPIASKQHHRNGSA